MQRNIHRTSYGGLLARCLRGAAVEVVAETPTLSRYVLRRGDSVLTVSFALGGDGRFLPVALASMTAKYVRELLMLRFNRFFKDRLPELKPTAGYHGDARRYVTDIWPGMGRLERVIRAKFRRPIRPDDLLVVRLAQETGTSRVRFSDLRDAEPCSSGVLVFALPDDRQPR